MEGRSESCAAEQCGGGRGYGDSIVINIKFVAKTHIFLFHST